MNLDELEAKALAASDARAAEQAHRPIFGADGMPDPEWVDLAVAARESLSDFWEAACCPDTILHLIERARAGEELYEANVGHADYKWPHSHAECLPCAKARGRWESLAHSPQEATP